MRPPLESMLDLIGGTPMVKLARMAENVPGQVWAKLELHNPSGSLKDRIALAMIEEAESTTVVPPHWQVAVHASGCLAIQAI